MGNSALHQEWYYVSGLVNVLECNLLNTTFFDRLLASNVLRDVFVNLNNTPLKTYFTHVKHLYEFEMLLDDYYYTKLFEIRSLAPNTAVCDFFLIKNDMLNLGNFVKSKACGTDANKYFRGIIDIDNYNNAWNGEAVSLPDVIKESVLLSKKSMTTVKKEELPFVIDLIIDSAYLKYIGNIYKTMKVEIINRHITVYKFFKEFEAIRRAMALKCDINLLNKYFLNGLDQSHLFHKLFTNTAWTSEKIFREIMAEACCNVLPHEDETFVRIILSNSPQNISFQYEVKTDDFLLDMIRPVRYTPFGPERVFGYLCGLTVEVFNLKLVLGGKLHKIRNNLLKERLRKTYV